MFPFKISALQRVFVFGLWCFSCLVSSPLYAVEDWAAELKQAEELLKQGSYSEAYSAYQHQAEEKRNPLAQFSLALFYDLGWGRAKDRAKACRWYEKAALAKLPAAQHAYADCLLDGVNALSDPDKAVVQYEQAAQGGHWISLCALAELYQQGRGVTKDPAKGVALCESLAEQGIVKAMRLTALFYLEGDPAIRDFDKGHAWLQQAATGGDPQAQYRLGLLERDNAEGKSLEAARFWLESAAAQGYTQAYFPVAELYFYAPSDSATGKPSAEHLAKAYLWLSAASRRLNDGEERRRAKEMLERVKAIMPGNWQPELDQKVKRHLEKFAPY